MIISVNMCLTLKARSSDACDVAANWTIISLDNGLSLEYVNMNLKRMSAANISLFVSVTMCSSEIWT